MWTCPRLAAIQREKLEPHSKLIPLHPNHHKTLQLKFLRKTKCLIHRKGLSTFRQNKGNRYNEKCSTNTTKYQGSLFSGLILNLWLQIMSLF